MAGSAVATMVWSTTARNIGSMMEGKTVRNSRPVEGFGCDVVFHARFLGQAGLRPAAAPVSNMDAVIRRAQ